MAKDLNHFTFTGRLGKDPEVRSSQAGDKVANFSVAVGKSWRDKNSGEKKEATTWLNCVAWKGLAEVCGQYLKKGSRVACTGEVTVRSWEKDGVKQYTTEIVLADLIMLDPPAGAGENRQAPPAGGRSGLDDQIPF